MAIRPKSMSLRVCLTLMLGALVIGTAAPAMAQEAEVAAPDAIAAARRSLSDRGLSFIERHEGFVDHVYTDSAGNCTIGYGHLLHHGACNASDRARYPHGITRARARELLRADVGVAERAVRAGVDVRLNQHQFDALVSFTFNVGTNAFKNSTLLRVLNQGRYSQVPAQMMRWTIGGLESRRRDEVRVWKYGDYT
jgi:lysozyme